MSRVILALVNSVLKSTSKTYLLLHANNHFDLEVAKSIGDKPISFEKNVTDINHYITIVSDQQLSNDLSIMPRYVVSTSFIKYEQAKNIGNILRVPVVNIIKDLENIKQEGIFNLCSYLEQDINLIIDQRVLERLNIYNYISINNLSEIPKAIEEKLEQWKPIY